MIAIVASATLLGVEGQPVSVEVHVSNGLPGFTVVGLPDAACRESRDRVRAALLSSGLAWPLRRVTVNLAPSGIRKAGAGLDLAMAVGLLAAAGEIPIESLAGMSFIGELGLDGTVRPVPGLVPMADALDLPVLVTAAAGAAEAGLVGRHEVRPVRSLAEVVEALCGRAGWPPPEPEAEDPLVADLADLADVRGQRMGRWALEVAAAGGHHLLLTGPPGAGKSMLARRLPGLLPPLSRPEALEVTKVHSAAGLPLPPGGLVRNPPFRAPHHSTSPVALVGGGSPAMRPGEISLAHRGVLFMDELGEFAAQVLDSLRQPLEDGEILVCRAKASAVYPARFLLVGATNPCPCGGDGQPGSCRCSDSSRLRYLRRLSGPILDRFDLRVPVARPGVTELLGGHTGEPSAAVAERVAAARAVAVARGHRTNAAIPAAAIDEVTPLAPAASRLLEHRLRTGELSARGLHRVRRVARTIADLAGHTGVLGDEHVCAALELRADLRLLEPVA